MTNDSDVDCCIGSGTLDNDLYMQYGRQIGIPQFIDAYEYYEE